MTPGLGPEEYAARQNSQDAEQIVTKGVNAPYHLTQYGLTALISDEILGLRLTSAIFALVIATFLFLLLRSWFGHTIALFASLIFLTTPWLVITARTGTANIMLLWLVVPLACFVLMTRSKGKVGIWWLLLCISIGLGLYIPGYTWFMLAALAIASTAFLSVSRRISGLYLILGMTIIILLVVPLILSLTIEPSRLKQLLLVPASWQPAVETLKSIGWAAVALLWRTREAVDIGIDHLAVLNILQIVLVIFGFYALASRARNIVYILSGLLVFSILIAGINNNPHYLLLGLPAIAVLVGAGLRYLFIEWKRVFPLNPFAYALAISLISLVVVTHLIYAARYSLVAWPQTSQTKSTYVLK